MPEKTRTILATLRAHHVGLRCRYRGARRTASLVALALLLITLAASRTPAASAYPGAPWFEPDKPYAENFPDPSVLLDPATGRYHAYATTTGGAYLPAMSSSDAATWVARPAYRQPDCVPFADDPFYNDALPCPASWAPAFRGGRQPKEIWAPGVAKIAGRFVLFYAARTVAPPGERYCLSVATSASPLGPFVDASADPLHCDADPKGSIDPQPFVDPATGTPYLIWKSEGVPGQEPTKFWVRQLSSDGVSFAPGSAVHEVLATTNGTWEGDVIESPSMVRYGDRWLLFYSANEWDSAAYATGVAFCSSPVGPCFKSPANPVLRSEGSMLGPGGPSAFVDAGGALRLAHHYWRSPHVGYPSDPGCDGVDPKTNAPHCVSQGQRRMRVAYVVVQSDRVTVTSTPPPMIAARNIDSACPATVSLRLYLDVPPDSPSARAISCITAWGITTGSGTGTYDPSGSVTREQMASFVARLIDASDADLPAGPDAFDDDAHSGHDKNIDRLAAAGIVGGTAPRRFSPQSHVSRAQMATFLGRSAAFVLGAPLPAGGDAFVDDDGSDHEAHIDAAAAAGVATGTGPGAFSPSRNVSRAQMASFLARLADVLVDAGQADPPLV